MPVEESSNVVGLRRPPASPRLATFRAILADTAETVRIVADHHTPATLEQDRCTLKAQAEAVLAALED